jgi:pimeloyl-ACP methyl ester carboxylesterase
MDAGLSRRSLAAGLLALIAAPSGGQGADEAGIRALPIGEGIALHYRERGAGEPVVFVHGSLSDLDYWNDQLAPFAAAGRRAIAYSRRYNWPNANPPRPGYSAVVDAQDLARLIERLELGRAHVVGHSYGALAALFLAARRPQLVRTLVLAEPPAVSLLEHVQGDKAELGRRMYADIQRRMVAPMRAAWAAGRDEAGVAAFIDYVFADPNAWARTPPAAKAATLRDVAEWRVMLTTGELFPELAPQAVRAIRAPTLQLSGRRSYPFLRLIDGELARLLPRGRRLVFADAGHQMWLQQPEACRRAALALQARGG